LPACQSTPTRGILVVRWAQDPTGDIAAAPAAIDSKEIPPSHPALQLVKAHLIAAGRKFEEPKHLSAFHAIV
jgi:hypothetical protein